MPAVGYASQDLCIGCIYQAGLLMGDGVQGMSGKADVLVKLYQRETPLSSKSADGTVELCTRIVQSVQRTMTAGLPVFCP